MKSIREWRLSLPTPTYAAAGRRLGVSGVQVMRYETGARQVPPEKARRYSRITTVPEELLCPGVFADVNSVEYKRWQRRRRAKRKQRSTSTRAAPKLPQSPHP